jgi:rare lipoprotein A
MKALAHLAWIALVMLLCVALVAGCGRGSWRRGGVPGSKPYTVRGKTYYPLKSSHGFVEEGVASWYGPGFHGKTTASGERYNQNGMTAAHKILPLGTAVRVTRLENGRSVVVTVNDRGPFVGDRVIDLSRAAATRLGMMSRGTARVRVQSIDAVPQLREDGGMEGDFYIQVGAFASKDNARKLVNILAQSGHRGRLFFGGNRLWNVQAGPWPDSENARRMLKAFQPLYPGVFVVGGP